MLPLKSTFFGWINDPRIREFFWFCLPALIVGLAIRGVVTAQMPYAYFHPDSPDLLTTADLLFHQGEFEIQGKKTFLVPVLYVGALLIPKLPAMLSIPFLQHGLGLLTILMCGGIVRLWFRFWKWVIIPVTLILAVHPSFLWYEHTLMPESVYVFCTVLLALIATAYALRPSRMLFAAFCGALFLEAGARPEGKLFFAFALGLVTLLFWKSWRKLGWHAGALLALGMITHLITKTSQAGLLLFISVLHMAPDELHSAPGIMQKLGPLKMELAKILKTRNAFPDAQDRKDAAELVNQYLIEQNLPHTRQSREVFCKKLANEIILRRWWLIPGYTLQKFESTSDALPSGGWSAREIEDKQINDAYKGDVETVSRLSKKLFGKEMKTLTEIQLWVMQHYSVEKVAWHERLNETWLNIVAASPSSSRGRHFNGTPYFFYTVILGVIATLITSGSQWKFHWSWSAMLFGLAFVIVLVANVKPRFRFVFEPFYFIYLAGIPNLLLTVVFGVFRKQLPP